MPGPSVFPSGETGVSGDSWGSQEGCQGPFRPSGRNRGLPLRPEAPVGQEAVSQLWTQSFMILGSRAHLLWDLDGFTVGSILLTRGPAALGMEFSLQRVETVSPNCWRTCALGRDGGGGRGFKPPPLSPEGRLLEQGEWRAGTDTRLGEVS